MNVFVETERIGFTTVNGTPVGTMFVASPEDDERLCTLTFDNRPDRPSLVTIKIEPREAIALGHALIAVGRDAMEGDQP